MTSSKVIVVKETPITIIEVNRQDYISLTDMVRNMEDGSGLIEKWLRNKNTIEFIGIWEKINNPNFNSPEFGGIMMEAGLNRFTLSAKKWAERTNAIGIIAKTGRFNSGTYAHKDIAFEFGSWLSAEFKLYLIKEFQRLKDEESKSTQLEWNIQRTLAKINYRIHTDAIKETLIPPAITRQQQYHLRQRSRPVKRGPVWPNRRRMEKGKPRENRKYTRRSHAGTAGGTHQS